MKSIAFTVPGIPRPKARPRLGKGHVYTPKTTAAYERTVAVYALRAMALAAWPRGGFEGAHYTLTLRVYWPDERCRDLDNAIKGVADAANGLIYRDDADITELHAYASVDRESPRVEIEIRVTRRREQ